MNFSDLRLLHPKFVIFETFVHFRDGEVELEHLDVDVDLLPLALLGLLRLVFVFVVHFQFGLVIECVQNLLLEPGIVLGHDVLGAQSRILLPAVFDGGDPFFGRRLWLLFQVLLFILDFNHLGLGDLRRAQR